MKLKLYSDYREFYDFGFDIEGYEFRRMTTDGPTRPAMFTIFKKLGLLTPLHGFHKTFLEHEYPLEGKVVVHTANEHRGDGKVLKTFGELTETDKLCFLVEYIFSTQTPFADYFSHSTRLLFVGSRCFQEMMISYDDWRSNCGDGESISFGEIFPCPKWRSQVYHPIFAIDFVGDTELKAIDFNVAPGVPKELYKYMAASQVVLEIKNWFKEWVNGNFDGED